MNKTAKKTFVAVYSGSCGGCEHKIKPGDKVFWDINDQLMLAEDHPCDSGEGEFSEAERAEARRKMCLDCFLVHAPGQKECY